MKGSIFVIVWVRSSSVWYYHLAPSSKTLCTKSTATNFSSASSGDEFSSSAFPMKKVLMAYHCYYIHLYNYYIRVWWWNQAFIGTICPHVTTYSTKSFVQEEIKCLLFWENIWSLVPWEGMDLNVFLSCGCRACSRIPPKVNAEHPGSLCVCWKMAAIFIFQQE